MLGINLLFFVHCAVFIGVNGYSISDHLKSLDDYQKKEGYKEDSDEIVGGHEVDITQYPHQVSVLFMDYSITNTFCGGSIISEQFVLSAAHCVRHNQNPDKYKIRAGSKYNGQGGRLYEINSFTVHPDFDKITFVDYDAALLRTRERIAINGQTTRIVQLASSDNLEPGTLVTVTGWGVTNTDSHVLNAVSLPVVDRVKCHMLWNKVKVNITDRMICAGYDQPGKSACSGDSGGPLVTETNVILYGIVSFGTSDCIGSLPNVYTNVAAVRDWIKQVAGV